MDEEAATAGKVVRCHDGGGDGEGGAWCHHIPVLGEWCSGVWALPGDWTVPGTGMTRPPAWLPAQCQGHTAASCSTSPHTSHQQVTPAASCPAATIMQSLLYIMW